MVPTGPARGVSWPGKDVARRLSETARACLQGRPMVTLSASAAALLAVFAGGWLAVALWATLRGRRTADLASSQRRDMARLAGLLASGPAVPLVVRRDGTLEGGERL